MTRRTTTGLLAVLACGGSTNDTGASTDGGTQGSTSTSGVETSTTGADADTTASSGDGTSSSEGSSTGDAPSTDESSTSDGSESTGGTALCAPAVMQSACDNQSSIVRGMATLAVADGPTTGNLLVLLNHEYLGAGASGGVPHTGVFYEGIDLSAGPVPFEIDMCSNGEMWSEENCEFVIHVALDLDADNAVDPGEPTGTATGLFLSCTGESLCLDISLDCVDGEPCVAFEDPAICGCAGNGESCNSPIVAC